MPIYIDFTPVDVTDTVISVKRADSVRSFVWLLTAVDYTVYSIKPAEYSYSIVRG